MKKRNAITGYFLIAPYIIGMLIFYLVPYIISIALSFTTGVGQRSFAGLSNYISLFQSKAFLLASGNTLLFTFIVIPIQLAITLLIALFLNEKLKKIEIYRSTFIVPLVLPTASIILFWQILFEDNGMANGLLKLLNIDTVRFLNSEYAMLVVILIFLWKYSGYNIVLFLSGLNSINKEYYENAQIDGANRWQCFWHITLPLITPTAFLVLIISFVNSLKIFREVYILSGAYPNEKIYMIQHFMNNNLRNLNYQRLSTASLILSIIIIAVIVLLYRYQKKTEVK